MVVFPTDAEFEALSLPGFCGDTLTLSEERLFQVADILDLLDPIRNVPVHQAVVESDPDRTAAFRRRLDELHILAENPAHQPPIESGVADAEFGAIAALVEALSAGRWNESRPELCSRSRAFCVATDYIREHASTSPSVEEICRVAGVSWRTLNYAFRERFDLTPKQYLKAVRLKQVRRDLVTSDPGATIAEISARSGFWHMGQLARDYRRQFGELPSETRKRS
jgi:AraC family ethanolamine operon transcriptional activator